LTILHPKSQVFYGICRTNGAYYKGCINKSFLVMQTKFIFVWWESKW